MKAVLTSLNTDFILPISRSRFKQRQISGHFISHCLALLCRFLGDFWHVWKERGFFSNDRLN